jgi:hypothetical protein
MVAPRVVPGVSRALEEPTHPPAKRFRGDDTRREREPYDVLFGDVALTGDPRDIAKAAVRRVRFANVGSVVNAIRIRERPATISIRFRDRVSAETFINTIQRNEAPGLEGMRASWYHPGSAQEAHPGEESIDFIRGPSQGQGAGRKW